MNAPVFLVMTLGHMIRAGIFADIVMLIVTEEPY